MIHLLFTGGTISMRRDAAAGGNVPALTGEALVEFAPELPRIAPFQIEDWGRVPACHLGPGDLWRMREVVRSRQAGDGMPDRRPPEGIVVAQGTDILEETAYLFGRTLDPEIPVVITGAMRTSSDRGWDGPRNLTDAARVAADPGSRGRGTMVVFAGKILPGMQATKTHATEVDAFEAPHGEPLGRVQGNRVEWLLPARAPSPRSPLALSGLTSRVALIPVVVGDQGELLDLARPGYDGAVLLAFGSGNAPPGVLPAVRRWIADRKPLVLASRCLYDQVSPVYAFAGGGATLVREGVVPAGPRTASQARMELAIALSAGAGYGQGLDEVP
jgi:L-asparaginase